MAVKFASAFGAEVTMLSTSPAKEADAKRLGAHKFVLTTDPDKVIDALPGTGRLSMLSALLPGANLATQVQRARVDRARGATRTSSSAE